MSKANKVQTKQNNNTMKTSQASAVASSRARFNPPSIGGPRNLPLVSQSARIRKKGRKPLAEDVWEVISTTLTERSVAALKFMLSPGDCTANQGIPDGDMNSTGFFIKKIDGLEVAKNSLFAAGDWDLMVITLPSLDIPIITLQKLSSTPEFKLPEMLGNPDPGIGIVAFQNVINKYQWSDVTAKSEFGSRQGLAGLQKPLGLFTDNFKRTTANVMSEVTPTYFSYIQGETSDVVENIASWRCTGLGATMFLNTNATENKGIVYTRPLERRPTEVSRGFDTRGVSVITAPTTPSNLTTYYFDAVGPMFVLNDVPRTVTELGTSPHYKGNAYEGVYTVSPFEGESKFLDTIGDRGLLTASRYVINGKGVSDSGTVLHSPCTYFAPDDSGAGYAAPNDTLAPRFLCLDTAFIPTITIFEGLDAAAAVSIKCNMGVEFAPTAGGPYANFSIPAPMAEPKFMEFAEALQHVVRPGYPASANGAWEVIKDIGRGAWSVFKTVAPFLLKLA